MKYIKRDYDQTAVYDFLNNVKRLIKCNEVAEEVYKNNELIGWEIKPLVINRE